MRLIDIPRTAFIIASLFAGGVAAGQQTQAAEPTEQFLRVVEKPGESLSLEVAARRYSRGELHGPEVALVGVAHIGDATLYRSLQRMLDGFDRVLYESVKPAGAGRPGGETDDDRSAQTRESLRFVAGLIALHQERFTVLPDSLDALAQKIAGVDPRLAEWCMDASVDGWGREVVYARTPDHAAYLLASLGSDGAAGGEGVAADIDLEGEVIVAHSLSSEDGLQAKLADALNLDFQLTAIDYGRPNWRCSDMTMDRLGREMEKRGLSFEGFGSTLAGSSLPAALVNGLLKIIKIVDAMADGMMSDMAKVMMIEVLGDESVTEQALGSQFGAGFAEVIVDERNQVVMDDLKRVIESEPEIRSVAIFYGAAHMPDFEERLAEQLGYTRSAVEWIPAMTINLHDSALTEAELKQMRQMIRRTLAGMSR